MQAEKLAAEEAIRTGLYGVGGSQVCSEVRHRFTGLTLAVEPSLDLWPGFGWTSFGSKPSLEVSVAFVAAR